MPPPHEAEDDDGHGEAEALLEERPTVRAAEPRLEWRRGFLLSDGLLIVLGTWLTVSPFVLDYGSGDAAWLPVTCGALIVVASISALAGLMPRLTAIWTVVALGALLLVGGVVLSDSSEAVWNAAAGGAMAALLAIVAAAAVSERPERSTPR